VQFVIADDHALVREGVVNTLKGFIPNLVAIEVGNGSALIQVLGTREPIDLILFDLSMPNTDAYEVITKIADVWPDIPLVVLSAENDMAIITKTIHLGASGFIPKSVAIDEMIVAIQRVLKGGVYWPSMSQLPELQENEDDLGGGKLVGRSQTLTRRQKEVIHLLAEGKTNRAIGDQLGLSERTIKVHITNIYKLLCVSNRTEALNKVRQLGIVSSKLDC